MVNYKLRQWQITYRHAHTCIDMLQLTTVQHFRHSVQWCAGRHSRCNGRRQTTQAYRSGQMMWTGPRALRLHAAGIPYPGAPTHTHTTGCLHHNISINSHRCIVKITGIEVVTSQWTVTKLWKLWYQVQKIWAISIWTFGNNFRQIEPRKYI